MNDKTNKPKLGKLEKGFPIRQIWPEETEFSAWLAEAEGLALLGDTLGMELHDAETEKSVGPFSADIVCQSAEGGVVVVENQLEKTNHDHLGKLLTYSAGLESATVVWIATTFTEQHRAALDWLNAQTVQEVQFFGLEVGLWKIGDSLLAPQLRIVCQPNEWTRPGGGGAEGQKKTSPMNELAREYWREFLNFLKTEGTTLPVGKLSPTKSPFLVISMGRTDFWLEPVITLNGGIRAALGLHEWAFNLLLEKKSAIQKEAEIEWEWKPQKGKNGPRIRFMNSGYDAKDRGQWPEQHQWLKDHLELLDKAFRRRIAKLKAPSDNDEAGEEE